MAGLREPTWEAAKMIRSNPNYVKMAEEYEKSTMSTSSTRTDQISLMEIYHGNLPWKSTLGKHIRDKVHSDMQPTDPQNNIKSTGNCELGNRQVDRIRPPPVQEASHDTST